jgi:hypothetical protein
MTQYIESPGLVELNKSKTRKSVLKKYNRLKLWTALLNEYKKLD